MSNCTCGPMRCICACHLPFSASPDFEVNDDSKSDDGGLSRRMAAPTPERPGTEECPKCGVEMCLHPGIHDGAFHCSAATTEEGEELEKAGPTKFVETVGMPYDESVRTPFMQAMGRVRALEAQLDAAQEEVRKLKEAAEILFNFEKQNLQIQQEIASLRAENAEVRNLRRDWERISDQHKAESTRLRELLQVAEGAMENSEEILAKIEHKDAFILMRLTGRELVRAVLNEYVRPALARLRSGKDGGKKDG